MPAKSRSHQPSIEPLEARIAPALLVFGANLLGGGSPSTGETSVGDHSATLVKVLSGQALVWFDGANITSISVGPGTKLDITGDVLGDIVANLEADGTLSDSDHDAQNGEDGGELLANNILGITTHPLSDEKGSIGNIISGGSVSNVNIAGDLHGIYAGDGVYAPESFLGATLTFTSTVGIDINPVAPGVQADFTLAKANAIFQPGASISGAKITQGISLQIFAGNGSPDGLAAAGKAVAGGSISNITIDNAKTATADPSYHLIAGAGGDGKKGGAGGSINSVIENSSSGAVVILAGNGGNGSGGAGGGGGSVTNLDLQSSSSQYDVTSGKGGNGTPGGAGGRMANNNFSNRTPIAGVLITADFNGDGLDDVLVADSGTGQMELSKNLGNGNFAKVVQYDPDNDPMTDNNVFTIDAAGSTPVDGLATDVNGDGKLDAVLIYKDGTMAAYLNQGNGSFYDLPNAKFAEIKEDLGFTPTKIAQFSEGSALFSVAENTEGKGVLHGVGFGVFSGTVVFEVFTGGLTYNIPIVDVVRDFVGLSDGTIQQFTATVINDANSLVTLQTFKPTFSGGLTDLDVDQGHSRLLAMSGASRSLEVFDVSGTTAATLGVVSLSTLQGKPLMAKFINDNNPLTNDVNNIVVLSNTLTSAQFTLLTALPDDNNPATPFVPYALGSHFESVSLLKNFAPIYSVNTAQPDFAALAGPLSSFTVVTSFAAEQTFPLDFASKQVTLTSGGGGDGLDIVGKLGKGGAGGDIVNLNIEAQSITLNTGVGGNSAGGTAGAGGSITNAIPSIPVLNTDGTTTRVPGSFTSAGGVKIVPKLVAEASLSITVGGGGTPTIANGTKAAAGGAGGSIVDLDITLTNGSISLVAGGGGHGHGGVGGAGGSIRGVDSLAQGGGLVAIAGLGGNAESGIANGGAGGSIQNLSFELSLDAESEKNEVPYLVSITARDGGTSAGGIGGAGGRLDGVSLKLDGADETFDDNTTSPPLTDAHLDTTVTVIGTAGTGGNGMKGGGAGGGIFSFSVEGVYDQVFKGLVHPNYLVVQLTAGGGGDATAGNGGVGGSVNFTKPLSGVSGYDPDAPGFTPFTLSALEANPALVVIGGAGGNGSVKGGLGGSISGLTAQNNLLFDGSVLTTTQLVSAKLVGGKGGNGGSGNGGAGGNVKDSLVGVSGGDLKVVGGAGGTSTDAIGGAGGAVMGSEFGLVGSILPVGMNIAGGVGGAGKTGGGVGGGLKTLKINTPQSTVFLSAILTGGNGGTASSAAGTGGKGGDINGITQAKDFNSSINLVQAGNGGDDTAGKGGAGGNVLNVRTVGFLGRPSDGAGNQLGVFDTRFVFTDDDNDPMTADVVTSMAIPQGVFSGAGGAGTGATHGINGSINNIAARQIAAMAAAVDPATSLFKAAAKVSNVKTALIGFDVDGDGKCDDQTDTPIVLPATPGTVVPTDGFLFAETLTNVTIDGKPAGVSRPAFVFDV